MVTPYKSAQGSEDDFNFYQSQLRIHVECAFEKLVHRWGILRRPLSSRIGFERTSSLVMALCRPHNFCIDSRHESLLDPLAQDEVNISSVSHIELRRNPNNTHSPDGILNGGEHFDDIGENELRRIRRTERETNNVVPRQRLHNMVLDKGLCRPPVS